jgi:hypothetical protein
LNFYTVILNFDGGTYVAQVDAETEIEAVLAWVLKLQREAFVPDHSARLADEWRASAAPGASRPSLTITWR